MDKSRWVRGWGVAGFAIAAALAAGAASAYTVPYSTPPGITLVDVSKLMDEAIPQFLWRRLGDANGNPLYTYDADQAGKSSCYDQCAKEFPPFVADAHAEGSGDFAIIMRDDHLRQWTYQGKPLYRYSDKDPPGEPSGARFELAESPTWHDPASNIYSPKQGWRRAAYTPEKTVAMPPAVELDGLAIANGFGLVEAASHLTVYTAPPSHALSSDWRPLRASVLALPVGEFSVVKRKADGTRQWLYRGEALYTYAGDYAPGEVTGIFSGDKSVHAALVYRNFIPSGITVGHYLGRGPLMTTAKGMTLYTVARYELQYGGRETRTGYLVSYNDVKEQGTVGCQGDCTMSWKPVLAPADAQAWGFWELVTRPDGSKQWAFKGSPIYTYVGDKKPGDIQSNNRHVVVYGGPQGEIVYSNLALGPRDLQSSIGKVDLLAAVGPTGRGEDVDAPPAVGDGAARGGGSRKSGARADAAKAVAAGGDGGRGGGQRVAGDRRQGAGFYWHVVGVFY
jgi:predicted lipoprotein with Yx(FWY)xxD motif